MTSLNFEAQQLIIIMKYSSVHFYICSNTDKVAKGLRGSVMQICYRYETLKRLMIDVKDVADNTILTKT